MASRRAQRQKQKRERQKARRKVARKERKRKGPGRIGKGHALHKAVHWPLGAAWVSSEWHERGAHVHAVLTRERGDGRIAASLFEVDLAERGIVAAKAGAGYTEERILGEVARRSERDAMIEIEPEVVKKIVVEGLRFGESAGHTPPRGLDDALSLFEDVEVDDVVLEVQTGKVAPPPPAQEGLLGSVKRWLFGVPAREEDFAPASPEGDEVDEDEPTEKVERPSV